MGQGTQHSRERKQTSQGPELRESGMHLKAKCPVELNIEFKEERGTEEGDCKVGEDWILGALVKHGRDFGACPRSKRKPL